MTLALLTVIMHGTNSVNSRGYNSEKGVEDSSSKVDCALDFLTGNSTQSVKSGEKTTDIYNGESIPIHLMLGEDHTEMARSRDEEKSLISSFNNQQKKYGTTSASSRKVERYISYHVKSGDTLQGIALKYNVTMEIVKRVNRLWTNDSLALRPTLQIPVYEPSVATSLPPTPAHCSAANTCVCCRSGVAGSSCCVGGASSGESGAESGTLSSNSTDSLHTSDHCTVHSKQAVKATADLSRQSASDFLSSIDSAIASSRRSVDKLSAGRAAEGHDEDVLFSRLPAMLAPHSGRYVNYSRRVESSAESEGVDAVPMTVIRNGRYSESRDHSSRGHGDDLYQL